MDRAEAAAQLSVSVVYSPRAGEVDEVQLSMSTGATVADALRCSGLQQRHPGLDLGTAPIGLWGALCRLDDVLRDRDRVEVYRPLRVDPKEARRQRYRAQVKTKRR
ncbi:MAG: RnfH family protein [Burkholderiales bacterium]|nr:RnfH family protein [Burkholderiales bacterium]MDE2628244.1 RnfH family protein [Burkholderiales bacterium]